MPFVVGLTTVRAVSETKGDYESVQVVEQIDRDSFRLFRAGETPDDDGNMGEFTITRRVRLEDQRTARILRPYFHTSDPEMFPGTSPIATAVMVTELRTLGHTSVTYLDVEPMFGMTVVKRKLTGSLSRIGPETVEVPMLVNGQRVALHALHAVGRLSDGNEGDDFDFYILDEPENPLLLRTKGPGFSTLMTKIEFPEEDPAALEHSLAKQRHAVVYGIYFAFARADIRPVSERVLKEIAAALRKNPDWRLRIDGHTDSIGGDSSNLELSRRRAAAVKTALVSRYGIAENRLTTGGYGASQPQETNATPEGRARNRRVELTRYDSD